MTEKAAAAGPEAATRDPAAGEGAIAEFERLYRANVEASYCEAYGQQQHKLQRLSGRRDLEPDQVEELLDRIDAERAGRDLVTGLAMLPERDRAVIELVDIAGFAPKEAAAALGLTPGSVRMRLMRTRARRHITSRRTLLATGTGFVAVAATVSGLMASGGGTPAYALTTHPNGTVTLDVYQVSGIAAINTKLHQVGDDQVVVVPVGAGCPSMSSLPAPIVLPSGHISVQTGGSVTDGGSVTVNAKGIPAGDILVVAVETTTTATGHYSMGAGRLTTPPAPSCVSLPAMPAGTGGSGSSSGSVTG